MHVLMERLDYDIPSGSSTLRFEILIPGACLTYGLTREALVGEKRMKKFLTVIPLSIALLAPLSAVAQYRDHDRDRDHDRYYDKHYKDYHQWNSGEERAWSRYWQDRHHNGVEWNRANERQREDYWRWRHSHPDSLLFQVNVR
jgi:hypothetical protein